MTAERHSLHFEQIGQDNGTVLDHFTLTKKAQRRQGKIVYAGYQSPNLANLMPANSSQALWHADPVHMDAVTPFDGTSFFFSLPSADVTATPDKQCCYDCCLQWVCCMGNSLSVAPARWSVGTPVGCGVGSGLG